MSLKDDIKYPGPLFDTVKTTTDGTIPDNNCPLNERLYEQLEWICLPGARVSFTNGHFIDGS